MICAWVQPILLDFLTEIGFFQILQSFLDQGDYFSQKRTKPFAAEQTVEQPLDDLFVVQKLLILL